MVNRGELVCDIFQMKNPRSESAWFEGYIVKAPFRTNKRPKNTNSVLEIKKENAPFPTGSLVRLKQVRFGGALGKLPSYFPIWRRSQT